MALGDVIAKLSVHLGLETAAFEKGSKRAETRMSGFEKNMSRASSAVKTAFVGMLGVFAVDQILSVGKAGLEYASSLGEVAQQLGVTTKALQEYRYAASQAGIEQGEMDQALSQLTRRLGDAAQGSKPLQAAFDKLGVNIRDTNGHVKDAGDVIPLIAEGLQKIESPAERAAILVDLFGKAGQKLAPLLEGGAAGVNNLRDAAHKLGIVLDDGMIQDADEAADKLSAMKQVLEAKIAGFVASNIKQITELADKLFRLADAALKATSAMAKWVGGEGPGGRLALEQNARIKDPGFTNGIATVRAKRSAPTTTRSVPMVDWLGQTFSGTRTMPLPKGGRGGGGGSRAFDSLISLGQSPGAFATKAAESGLVRMAQAANDIDKPIAAVERNLSSVATKTGPKTVDAFKKIKIELDALRTATQGIFDRLFPDEAEARRYAEEVTVLNTALAKGQITVEDHTRAVAALRREYSGFADEVERASVVVSQNFGPSLDDISDSIADRLPVALGQMEGKAEATTVRVAKSFGDMARDIGSSLNQLSNAIKGGGFLDILTSVLDIGVQLGSSGLFGKNVQTHLNRIPGYANGTSYARGGLSLVGERGPELVNLRRGASVTPNNKLGGMGNSYYFNGNLLTPEFWAKIQAGDFNAANSGAATAQSSMARGAERRLA